MLSSTLFAGDGLLQDIADDVNRERLSTTQHKHDPAVMKVQQALLFWDPSALPVSGADGDYGGETATAVHRFKAKVIGVLEAEIIDDVGPQTVRHLDAIAFAHEQSLAQAARIAELDDWLTPALSGVFSAVSSSDVAVHVSGADAFLALKNALDKCVDGRAVVVIAGWDFHPGCPIAPGITIGDALTAAAGRGASVRALINHFPVVHLPLVGDWHPPGTGDNTGAVAFINGLPGGAAIHDERVLHHTAASIGFPIPGIADIQLGVHHQKAWAVFDGDNLTAWCGGMDLNPNRTGPTALHDVQAELHGSAAAHVYALFRLRWEDHPSKPAGTGLPVLGPSAVVGTHRARITTTFGDPTQFAGLGGPPYSFAPAGSTATRQLLSHMIDKAQRFIYVEDQYFIDESMGVELAAAMAHLDALIVVICDSNSVNGELHQAFARRRAAFAHLAPHAAKVAVVIRNNRFVHAKTWVFDDTMVMVGSTNINRRGFQHDSEIGVSFGDILGTGTAGDIRERLWSLHLGASAPAAGSDPVAALPLWKTPPAGSRISTCDWTVGADSDPVPSPVNVWLSNDEFWTIVDPSCP